jgi:hypothetical protein
MKISFGRMALTSSLLIVSTSAFASSNPPAGTVKTVTRSGLNYINLCVKADANGAALKDAKPEFKVENFLSESSYCNDHNGRISKNGSDFVKIYSMAGDGTPEATLELKASSLRDGSYANEKFHFRSVVAQNPERIVRTLQVKAADGTMVDYACDSTNIENPKWETVVEPSSAQAGTSGPGVAPICLSVTSK